MKDHDCVLSNKFCFCLQIKVSPSQKLLAYSVKFGQNFGPEGAKVIIKDIESGLNLNLEPRPKFIC